MYVPVCLCVLVLWIIVLRRDTVVETKPTLKVIRTRLKRVLIYSKIEDATLCYFESGQNKTKVCSYILKDRECNPLVVTMDTRCKLYFKRDNILQLRARNSFVDYQLPCHPLNTTLYLYSLCS